MSKYIEKWMEAKRKYKLSDKHIQMARELGLNPAKKDLNAENHRVLRRGPLRAKVKNQNAIKMEQQLHSMMPWLITTIIILTIWDSVWKLIAMWKAGRNNHLAWFICIALINTIGILPIIYILIQRKKEAM